MNTKPTQGPWAVNEFDDLDGDHHIQVCADGNGCPVAHLYENGRETRANARLIAAAPELLEALQAFINAEHLLPQLSGPAAVAVIEARVKAVGAISKATGSEA
jgi:hypothetical protein